MINKIKDMRIGSTVRTDNNMPYHTGYIKFICPSMINIVIGWLEKATLLKIPVLSEDAYRQLTE